MGFTLNFLFDVTIQAIHNALIKKLYTHGSANLDNTQRRTEIDIMQKKEKSYNLKLSLFLTLP